jgi:O-antigen/teichoic acid export membrane protein
LQDPEPEHRHVVVSQRLVAINAASSLVARLLNVTVLLWMYQYLLTRISPGEFAVYAVLMALMAFAPLFFSVFTGGVSRYIVEAYALGQPRRVAEITSSILPLLATAATAFTTTGLVIAAHVEDVLTIAPGMEDTARLMLTLLVINYALQVVTLPYATGFHVRQRFVELNTLGILRDVLKIILLVTFLVGIGPSVLWVVVANVVADQTHLLAVLYRSRQLVPEVRFKPSLFRWATGRKLVSFGLWTTMGQLANMMATSVGILILNEYGTALDVTVYHLGATAYRQIESAIGLAAFPLLPALTAMHSLADRARLARTTLRGGRYGLWVALFVACPAAIFSREFVQLYLGEGFADAAIVLSLFMGVFLFVGPTSLLPMLAMAMARVRDYHLAFFTASALGLLLTLYLVAVRGLGAIGVALSLLITMGVAELFYFWPLQRRLTETRWGDFFSAVLFRGLLPAAVASGVWMLIDQLAPPSSWLTLVVAVASGGVVYAAVLFGFCLDENDRNIARRLRSKLLGR